MKTSTLKKMLMMLCGFLLTGFFTASAVLSIGSIKGTAAPLYAQGSAGGNIATPITTATLDYKVVTKGSKSWAYLHFNGTSGIDISAGWTCQLRYWSSTNGKTENNMTDFRDATNKIIYGSATTTIPNPLNISFFQNLNPGGFAETLLIPYNITTNNSPVSGDVTPPTITACDVNATETSAALTFTGSDNSGDLFYYIVDSANGIEQFALSNSFTLNRLSASTNYNLTITPIDFNGNEGTPLVKSFTTGGLVQITSGIAKDIKFVLKSTTTQLEYYYQLTDPTKKFRDAFLQITPAGGTMFEIKPTLSPDSTYVYGVTTDSRIANQILALNCGYWIAPGLPDYSDYVVSNTTITAGSLTGTPIKHQMGGGISPAEVETTAPVLNSATLTDVTPKYVKLNINGSDNSGTVFYTISGAKSTVDAFRTGDYYLTAIDPGKVYNLTVTPYDLSGNTAAAQTLTVKTMNARSNIQDSTTTNYNTLVLPVAPAGELVTIIKSIGNNLTLGCTTKSLLIPAGASRNKKFNNPTIVINGTTYPLTISADSLTATVTFNGTIGTTAITSGASFNVKWSVFWGSAGANGTPAGGNYFTGTFTYVVGDTGQTDVSGPSTPVLTLNGSALTWPACTDDLSGVKSYVVSETGQTPVTIFDLGGASFSYNMVNATSATTVKAVDFVGNSSSLAGVNGAVTSNRQITLNAASVYPNPATNRIYVTGEVSNVSIYSLQGQLVHTSFNKNTVDVSTFAKGMYLVKVTDKLGNQNSTKLEIQ
jgi:hypothetical protein